MGVRVCPTLMLSSYRGMLGGPQLCPSQPGCPVARCLVHIRHHTVLVHDITCIPSPVKSICVKDMPWSDALKHDVVSARVPGIFYWLVLLLSVSVKL